MEYIIGSVNKAKVKAVTHILKQQFPTAVVHAQNVESGVSNQPFGDEETRQGALNRAKAASILTVDSVGVGLEGGVKIVSDSLYLCNWGALVLPDGTEYTAAGAQIPLPEEIAVQLKEGGELGPIVDLYFRSSGIRQKEGAIGMFTAQLVNRDKLFEHIMKLLVGQMLYFGTTS